ncbi:MAG: bifunctional 3-deoxy-7-phosphoheptulonate synthase/chorismate mutase type II [Crocinitomicaceae bacterium]
MNLQHDIKTSSKPFVIAGPCSVENPEQIKSVAQDLANSGRIQLLRGGIWKPRTRPDSFEGVGAIGLPWLVEAGKAAKLPVCIEIANKHHVEVALEAGVDVLWIGARTTVNPFAVQEIADVLKGTNVPVMIKNPINPDLELWIGAFERLEKAGIADLTAIHRGFSVYKHPKYRNVPSWEIPIALRERLPHIPLICDPSHISGRRDLLLEVSQKGLDLNFDGLMIETHPHPDLAWSDAAQQVTPEALFHLLDQLVLRTAVFSKDAEKELDEIRHKIANLDDRVFDMLSARMQMSEDAGELKREHNITIFQQEHWAKMKNKRLAMSENYKLTPFFIQQMMEAIHLESIRHQTKVMNPNIDTPNNE